MSSDFKKKIPKPSSFEDDVEFCVDGHVGSLPLACRDMDFNWNDYKNISIRCKTKGGGNTEIHKIFDNRCKSLVYVYEFRDVFVICKVRDIKRKLERGEFHVRPNGDGTAGAYMTLNKISHFIVAKDEATEALLEEQVEREKQEVEEIKSLNIKEVNNNGNVQSMQ